MAWVASIAAAATTILLLLAASAGASPALQEMGLPAAVGASQSAATWNSGWVDIAAGTLLTLTHDLGGSLGSYGVDLWFRDTAAGGLGINQRAIGGLEAGGNYYGAYWQGLNNSTIQVVRLRDDVFADQVFVHVWTADSPAWDSGWVDIAAGALMTLTHNVGGNQGGYVVDLWLRDTTPGGIGINAAGYGGLEMAGQIRGAGWQSLTASTITVRRYRDDIWADQVRVRIFVPEPPAWDSGWVNIAAGTVVTLPHNLGGNPLDYAVRDWHRDTTADGIGINHQFAGGYEIGGNFLGANWQDLTGTTIHLFRFANDGVADQMRVRIWVPTVPATATPTLTLTPTPTPTATPTFTPAPTGVVTACVPALISPAPGAVMDNGRHDYQDSVIWDFDWADCPGATAYHLYVIGPTATIPTINSDTISSSSYHYVRITYIADENRLGWTWKVCAKVDGQWGPWSETRTFDVEPVDTDSPNITLTPTAIGTPTTTHTPSPTATRSPTPGAPTPTPSGHWESWTNGNFVRDLALGGGVLWAGTEGGAVRWNPATGSYTKYLAPDGLRDGYVKAIVLPGVSWFGTYGGGLVAYDGTTWIPFTTTHGLPSNFVQAIALQGSTKWVGTDYGLSALDDGGTLADRADDRCTAFRTTDGLASNNIRAATVDGGNRKWLATSAGLSVLDDGGTPHDKTNDTWAIFKKTDGLVDDSVYAVVVDAQNRIWAGTVNGLSVLDPAGTPFVKTDDTWASFGATDGLADDDVYDLALDSQGRVWIATYGGGIFVLDTNGTPFVKTDDTWTQFNRNDGLVSNDLYALVLDETGQQVWAGSWGYGISRLSYGGTVGNKADDSWTTFAIPDPLPINSLNALLADGDVAWIGASGGGMVATDGQRWTTFSASQGLVSNYTYALAADGHMIWVGTASGVNVFDDGGTPHDTSDDQWASFRHADGLWTETVNDLDVDAAGRLWVDCNPASYTGYLAGLSVLDDSGTPFDKTDDRWMTFVPTDTNGVSSLDAYEIALDGAQRVWIAGEPLWDGSKWIGGGLALLDHGGTLFDKADDTWTVFTTTHGLPDSFVYSVAMDSAGRVWAGTGLGLAVLDYHGTPFNKTDDTWTKFSTADGLANLSVMAITFDAEGRLWLATNDGVSLLDTHGTPDNKTDDTWASWRVADGLVDSSVNAIAVGSSGAVWAGTFGGLSRMILTNERRVYLPVVVRNR
jgi:ligand-binding sensor domain-containing protein